MNNLAIEITEADPIFGTHVYDLDNAEYDLLVEARTTLDQVIQQREREGQAEL